jgi:uncharacterized protein (TIGR04255 family)
LDFRRVCMPLPVPDRTLLATPPLVVTLAQVRFDVRDAVAGADTGAALVERANALGLTNMTQIHHQQVVIVPVTTAEQPGPVPVSQPAGWQFAMPDGGIVLSVLTDQMTLETRHYRGWDAFSATWEACLDALAEIVAPALTTRLGLRYVNRVTPAGVTRAVEFQEAGLVDPAFLGAAVDSPLSEYVTAAEGRVALRFPDGTDALVQHGVVNEAGAQVFVLDIDCFRTQGAPFDRERVVADSYALNQSSLQVFQTVVREPLRDEMKKAESQ